MCCRFQVFQTISPLVHVREFLTKLASEPLDSWGAHFYPPAGDPEIPVALLRKSLELLLTQTKDHINLHHCAPLQFIRCHSEGETLFITISPMKPMVTDRWFDCVFSPSVKLGQMSVHSAFYSMAKCVVSELVRAVKRDQYKEVKKVIIIGSDVGGSVASLVAYELRTNLPVSVFNQHDKPDIQAISFAPLPVISCDELFSEDLCVYHSNDPFVCMSVDNVNQLVRLPPEVRACGSPPMFPIGKKIVLSFPDKYKTISVLDAHSALFYLTLSSSIF